jgi:hypothetical protein
MLAQDKCGWTPLWSESHSRSYGLSEEQVQACLDQPGPGQDTGREHLASARFADISKESSRFSDSYERARVRLVQYPG